MNYLSAQDAAGNIWSCTYRIEPDLAQKILDLSLLDVDLSAPELLPDEELIAAHEFLGSIFHHPDWGRLHVNATQLPIPGGSFDFYCVERVYLAIARHAHNRAWEYNPKHANWIASESQSSLARTGGYISCFDILPGFDWTDPALNGPLDAPTWFAAGSCCEPHVGSSETYPSHPRFKCIPARLS